MKKAQNDELINVNQINVELKINKNTFQTLNDKKNTFMSKEVNNVTFINNIFDVIITHSQSNHESNIKKNQKNDIFMTSIEAYDDENFANLMKFDDILNQNTTIDEQFIE